MIMISMPMGSNPNWRKRYKEIKTKLESQGYEVAPLTYKEMFGKRPPDFIDGLECQHTPLLYMAHSFYRMCMCDTVYFAQGWEEARGCRIEHWAALDYGLKVMYENDEDEEKPIVKAYTWE